MIENQSITKKIERLACTLESFRHSQSSKNWRELFFAFQDLDSTYLRQTLIATQRRFERPHEWHEGYCDMNEAERQACVREVMR